MRICRKTCDWRTCAVLVLALAAPTADAQRTSPAHNEPAKVAETDVAEILRRLGAKLERGIAGNELDGYSLHFDRIDLDRDGKHTWAEFVERGTYLSPQARGGIFRAADSNADDVVTEAEYVLNRIITDEAKAIAENMDDDQDGLVDRAEFVKHATKMLSDAVLAEQVFAALDANADGQIPIPEYLRVWGGWARVGQKPAEERIAARRRELTDSASKALDSLGDDWQPTEQMIDSARGPNPRFNMASRVLAAEYTGLSRAELGQARQQGVPMADLIRKNGRSVDEYLQRTLKIGEAVLERNVREGLISRNRADAVRGFMRDNVRAMVYGRVDRSERHLAQPLLDFELPVRGLSAETDQLFTRGKAIFKRDWVQSPSNLTDRDGLGPRFNAVSCNACHFRDGRARPETGGAPGAGLLVHLSVPAATPEGPPQAEPTYGNQFHDLAVPGQRADGRIDIRYELVRGEYGDGRAYELRRPLYRFEDLSRGPMHDEVMVSPRIASHLVGMGLLEAIPESVLLTLADPDDRDGDGVSGRPNRVWNRVTGQWSVGRFGWKAGSPTVLVQTATAFFNDMGITSSLFPEEPLANAQQPAGLGRGGLPEISDNDLRAVAAYASLLAVPPRREVHDPAVKYGQQLFTSMNCTACHTPCLPTAGHAEFSELAATEIEPYTDLLLHDMGAGLADGRPDGLATGSEWRTPPLWGTGLFNKVNGHTFFLHDGRARNLEEAILWHDGEASSSREAFRTATAQDRSDLIAFLESL